MIAPIVKCCLVSSPPDGKKEVQDVPIESPLRTETAQQIGLFLVGRRERPIPGGYFLGQDLAELSQPDQTDNRVIRKLTLRERIQFRGLAMSQRKEAKVGTCGDGRHGGYGPSSADYAQAQLCGLIQRPRKSVFVPSRYCPPDRVSNLWCVCASLKCVISMRSNLGPKPP